MNDIRRFLPLVGTLTALIGLAIAGAALTNNKQIPRVDPAPVVLHTQIQSTPATTSQAPPETSEPEASTQAEPQSGGIAVTPNMPVAATPTPAPPAAPPALQIPQIPGVPPIPPVVLPVVPQVPLNYQPFVYDDDWDD